MRNFREGDIVVAPGWFKGEAEIVAVHWDSGAIKVRAVGDADRLPTGWLDSNVFATKEEAVARALMEGDE